jgi:hypothetical protein
MSGLGEFSIWSTLAWVTPASSAFSSAKWTHLTMVNHCASPWRTDGPSGSLDMTSGSTTWSAGLAICRRWA